MDGILAAILILNAIAAPFVIIYVLVGMHNGTVASSEFKHSRIDTQNMIRRGREEELNEAFH